MQGKAQTGSYMKAIVIRTGFMTTKVGICLFVFVFVFVTVIVIADFIRIQMIV